MMKRLIYIFIAFVVVNISLNAQNLTGVKICINPGHGGFDSDDRNVAIAPFAGGDQNGFWESQSNLDKGKHLRTMLEAAGATVIMTRVTNTTADDLGLSTIIAMANQGSADFMLSIHTNAGSGVASHVLMLYAGKDANDTFTYDTPTPWSDRSRDISTVIAENLYANQITTWSSGISVRGDKTFARTAMGWSDGYGVLRGLTVPGVISEGSMHDYIPETYRLMNMDYKWLEAWNFFKSFSNYFKSAEVIPTGNIAGSVRDSRMKLETSYNKFAGKDQMLPLNGATLTLVETGETYTVDQMQNGVFVFKNLAPGTYNVKAEAPGSYSQTQAITVTAGAITYYNFSLNRVRNTVPQVVSYSPNTLITDSVETSSSILMNFNWDMDEASTRLAFSITPHVDGVITFEDTNYRMRFTPNKPFDKATVYTVKLAKSASHPDNLSMTEDFSFQFLTKNRNRLALLNSYPNNDNNAVYIKPLFRFVFDKVLNTANLQSAIKVYDQNGAELTKNARTFLNNKVSAPYGSCYFELSAALNPNQDYKVVIPGNVVDDIGMAVVEPIVIKFRTSPVLVSNQPVSDDFENANYAYDATQSSEVTTAAVAKNSTKKLFGLYSNLFTYSFAKAQASVVYRSINPTLVIPNGKVIGLHIYGDLSGNELQLQFSSGANVQYVKMCDLNFFGWEYKEVKINALPLSESYQFTGFKIIRKSGVLTSAGELSFDNMLLYDNPILSVSNLLNDAVKVYPNPTSDFIRISLNSPQIPMLELYSVAGTLLKKTQSTEMKVTEMSTGTYILKVILNNNCISYPVMIIR